VREAGPVHTFRFALSLFLGIDPVMSTVMCVVPTSNARVSDVYPSANTDQWAGSGDGPLFFAMNSVRCCWPSVNECRYDVSPTETIVDQWRLG